MIDEQRTTETIRSEDSSAQSENYNAPILKDGIKWTVQFMINFITKLKTWLNHYWFVVSW